MNAVVRLLAGFALLLGAARAAERDVVRTFSVQPGGTLSIDTYHGAITITESDRPEIRVSVHLEIGGDTEEESAKILEGLTLSIESHGNDVDVTARAPGETGARFVWNDRKRVEPTYRITVPTRCNVRIHDRQGAIVVGNLEGNVSAQVGAGDVFFRHIIGSVTASTDEGDIVVSQSDGPAKVHVAHGAIQLGVLTGPCEATDASGGIEIMAAKAGLHAHAEAGNIVVGLPKDLAATADLSTSGGGVVLKIDPAASCEVDASTSIFSHVDCRLPLKIEAGGVGRRRLVGRLNQGTVRVVAHASGGNVMLLPGTSAFE